MTSSAKGEKEGPVLFGILIEDIGGLHAPSDDTKPSGALYVLEGRDAIQRDIYRLEE